MLELLLVSGASIERLLWKWMNASGVSGRRRKLVIWGMAAFRPSRVLRDFLGQPSRRDCENLSCLPRNVRRKPNGFDALAVDGGLRPTTILN